MGVTGNIGVPGSGRQRRGAAPAPLVSDLVDQGRAALPGLVGAAAGPLRPGRSRGFNLIMDNVNRLPRPAIMLITVGLFGYAAIDPTGFADRMRALSAVPEPLWWLMGAVTTFYFGAREAHYLREAKSEDRKPPA